MTVLHNVPLHINQTKFENEAKTKATRKWPISDRPFGLDFLTLRVNHCRLMTVPVGMKRMSHCENIVTYTRQQVSF